jgi:hypothetical protein
MTQAESFEELRLRQEAAEKRYRSLAELGHQWDHTIRHELKHLAHALWSNGHTLDLLPFHQVRLRHHFGEEAWTWWIERDIPPYDRYHCEAYRVMLALDGRNEPTLSVQSGAAAHQVAPLTAAVLKSTLAQTGEDRPLLIPRAMGKAMD